MRHLISLLALVGWLALAGAAAPAHAGTTAETADSELAAELQESTASTACQGVEPIEARRLAREAQTIGEHQRAADCFLIAGDNLRAHRAMLRATADAGAEAKRNAAATAEAAKNQARRLRAAFR